jgi:hypothetical protein
VMFIIYYRDKKLSVSLCVFFRAPLHPADDKPTEGCSGDPKSGKRVRKRPPAAAAADGAKTSNRSTNGE